MTDKELHDLRYINWRRDGDFSMLTQHGWNEQIDFLKSKGAIEVPYGQRQNTKKGAWARAEWTYSISKHPKVVKMYVSHIVNRGRRNQTTEYFGYMTFLKEDKNEYFAESHQENPGKQAMGIISDMFKERNGLSLRKAFGYLTKEETYSAIRKCAVAAGPLIYVVPHWVGKVYYHGYKADISSAYPDTLRGRLPDWHTVDIIPGRQEPTEEYPFVFWSDGHHAEYQSYDTREFIKNKWFLATNNPDNDKLARFGNTTGKDYVVSYCCKASEYTLTAEMEELYRLKETDLENKDHWKKMLVAFIGKTIENHKNPEYPMPHLGAVCYGRQIKKMLELTAQLEKEGNIPVSFAVDSIIWCGKKSKTAVAAKNKKLGSFVSEFEDAEFAFGGTGLYAMAKNGKIGIIKHQGKVGGAFKKVKSLTEFLMVCDDENNKEEIMVYNSKSQKFIKTWRA